MIRVSTYNQYRLGTQSMLARQREMLTLQQQMSSGKRIGSPADDPAGAATATGLRAGIAQLEQYKSNQDQGTYLLNLAESSIASVVDGLQDAQASLVAAGNGSYSDTEKKAIATELEGVLARLVGLANASDGLDGYLFAGSKVDSAPFAQSGNTVSFSGDELLQQLEVAQDRRVQVRFSGDELFNKIRAGNGSFVTAASASNTGSAQIDPGSVTDPSALTGLPYAVSFTVSGGVTSYSVVRTNADATLTTVASGTYESPAAIDFDGIRINISGAAADGDSFSVTPSTYQSMFESLTQAIEALKQPTDGDTAAAARQRSTLMSVQASLAGALDHVLSVRAQVGSGLNELDAYSGLNDDRQLQYETRLSGVEDLDYASATAQLSGAQLGYQAALQSYSMVSKLSLFDYL